VFRAEQLSAALHLLTAESLARKGDCAISATLGGSEERVEILLLFANGWVADIPAEGSESAQPGLISDNANTSIVLARDLLRANGGELSVSEDKRRDTPGLVIVLPRKWTTGAPGRPPRARPTDGG
jgi:hypothetical protein